MMSYRCYNDVLVMSTFVNVSGGVRKLDVLRRKLAVGLICYVALLWHFKAMLHFLTYVRGIPGISPCAMTG